MKLIYGLAQGQTERYMEELLCTNAQNQEDIEKIYKVASEHGYHSFRVANFVEGTRPDFTKTLNI